jgi:hypothetical protein
VEIIIKGGGACCRRQFPMSSVNFSKTVEIIRRKFYQNIEEIIPSVLMNINFLKENQHFPLCWLGKISMLKYMFQTAFGTVTAGLQAPSVHGVNTIKCESSYISRHFDFRSSLLKQKMKLNIL